MLICCSRNLYYYQFKSKKKQYFKYKSLLYYKCLSTVNFDQFNGPYFIKVLKTLTPNFLTVVYILIQFKLY